MLGKSRETTGLGHENQQQSLKWYRGSSHSIGTSKGLHMWATFNQPAKVLEHELQQNFGAQNLF
jgi:hypothetical protein